MAIQKRVFTEYEKETLDAARSHLDNANHHLMNADLLLKKVGAANNVKHSISMVLGNLQDVENQINS